MLYELRLSVLKERRVLIHSIVNYTIVNSKHYHDDHIGNLTSFVSRKLGDYEEVAQEAVRGGVSLPLDPHISTPLPARWNFLQAVFFASTVLTTIGTYRVIVLFHQHLLSFAAAIPKSVWATAESATV